METVTNGISEFLIQVIALAITPLFFGVVVCKFIQIIRR